MLYPNLIETNMKNQNLPVIFMSSGTSYFEKLFCTKPADSQNKAPKPGNHLLIILALLISVLLSTKSFGQTITNYSFAASGSSFTVLSSPANPSLSGGDTDDGYFNAIPIGFDFWYMANRYTTLSASTNGWLTFGSTISDALYVNNLSAGSVRPIIAPLWDDIDIISTSNFSYKTTGTTGSRVCCLQWLNAKWDYSASGARISFQVRLYESTGKIEFIYQQVGSSTLVSPSASIGIAATATGSGNYFSLNNASATPTANSTTETNTINTKPANGQLYSFTPPVPASPSSLTFSAVGNTSMTLNWTDNASNERGYVVYRSDDGGTTYSFVSQLAANSNSSAQSGLIVNTTYFWKVYAVTEGGLSNALAGSQATGCTPPAAPTVTSPVNYCKGATASQLTATGSNLNWLTGGSGTIGGTSTLTSTVYSDASNSNKRLYFTTTIDNIAISKIDYYIPAWQAVNGMTLSIYNSAGTVIATSSTVTTQTAGSSAVRITNIFNYTVAAAGNYYIAISAGSGNIGSDNPSFPITESYGVISLTGISPANFRCFNNIQFSGAVSSTAPTPSTTVTGTTHYYVTQTVGGCTGPAADITVNVTAPDLSQVPSSNRIAYYRFEGNANDAIGNNQGIPVNAPTSVADRFGISNKAYSFNGSTQYITTSNVYTNPADFTISIWFKTTAVTGGKLIGFGVSQNGQSWQYDRHIYMNNSGQIYFGVYPSSVHTINSSLNYNDGNWHLATATLSSTAGITLYVDGSQVAADAATTTAEYTTGYWRFAYDNNAGWTSQPNNFYFNGSLDDVLIYDRVLTAVEINTLYNAPDGAGNNGPVCTGSSLMLSAISLAGATYAWSGPNSFSSTQQNPSFNYAGTNAGVYTVQVTNAGCTATAYTNVVSSTNTGQWTGNVSTDWALAGNWCNNTVPVSSTNVVITAGAVRMPSILSSVSCNSLTINSGATVTTTAAGTLNIAGTLTNNGTMTNNGTTVFNGTVQQSFAGINTFNNVTLNNPGGLLLPSALVVNNNLTLTAGILNANNFSVSIAGNWVNNVSTSAFTAGTSTVTFNGSGAQSVAGSFATTFNNLTVSNASNTVSLGANAIISGNLTVASGTFDLGSYTANRSVSGGILTVANNATLKIGGTNTFPSNYSTNTLVVASTVEYSGTNQTVSNKTYGNLKLSSAAGAAVKTFPATALPVVGNLISVQGAGSSVTFTAASNITVGGNVSLGASTTFNSGAYLHSIGGNWINDGTFNGNTGTITFTGSGSTVNGSGAQNFNNLTVAASLISFSTAVNLSGNLTTTGSGSFSQASGGTLTMTGSAKTISGSGISIENLVTSGSVSTAVSLTITGNLSGSGSFTASAGTITMSGATKTLSGAGTKAFNIFSVPGSVTTDANFTISSGMIVSGTFVATAGTATFTGSSTLSGTVNLFNVNINGTSLQLAANSTMGIANVMTITAGSLNTTSSSPNTVNFNGSIAQTINAVTYCHLILSNGNTKTAAGNITTNRNITIGNNTTFNPSSFTISLYGDWINNGTFIPATSTISFAGPANAFITGATTFNILTSNTSGSTTELILNDNVSATTVNMINGIITTGSDTITITGTRTGNGYIYGNIRRNHSFTTGVAYAFEGPNNTINFSAVSAVTGIIVSVTRGPATDFPYGNEISRLYNINIPTGTYTATFRLHYEDNELNGNAESAMGLWNYDNSLGWIPVGKSANSSTLNYVEQTGLTNISDRWTCSFNPNVVLWNGSVSSDWNTAANWSVYVGSGTTPPSASDVVVIGATAFNHQPTISTAVNVKNIVFGSQQPVNLSLASGGALNTGDIIGLWSSNATHSINANNQAITVNGSLYQSDGVSGHAIDLNIGNGTVTISGSLVESGGANINFSGTGILDISKDFVRSSGTFTAGAGTVIYSGTENQDVAHVSYNNLTINKSSGIAALDFATGIAGNLLISSGAFDNAAATVVLGNVTISAGATFTNYNILHIGGNWINNGIYSSNNGGTNVIFDGTGTQTISATTFNNLEINKPVGSVAELTGDVVLKGNLMGTSGTLDIKSYFFNRDVVGGSASMTDNATLIAAADNAPNKFSSYYLAPNSTVIFNGTGTQHLALPGVVYGNLTFRNSGTKILYTDVTVNGKLLIENPAIFDGGANVITLNGSWQNDGTFLPATSTVVCSGAGKTISGTTTFNKVTITGSYTNLSNITYNDLLYITATGSISCGPGIFTTLNGDLVNKGILYTLGTTTFTGNALQTLSLINAVQTVALIVNFNGSVSPVLNSTSAPQFGYLNINNTGGVNPSVGWTILYSLTVGNGASFNTGSSTHSIMGSVLNNGTISSSGILQFIPSSAVTVNLGNNFTSTGRVIFGGTGAMSLAGNPASFNHINITNTNLAGITSSSDWNMTGNLSIDAGSLLNAGNRLYNIGGNIQNNGTINSGASVFRLNGNSGQDVYSSSSFNDLLIEKTAGSVVLLSDITIAGTLNFVSGSIQTGDNSVIISSTGTVSGASASTGWINGRLKKYIATGATAKTFETGDNAYYTPVDISFALVQTGGNLTVRTTGADHPQLSNSVINPNLSLNRYWTLVEDGLTYTSYDIRFHFVPADIDAGASPISFGIEKYNETAWVLQDEDSANTNFIKALAVTAMGDFGIGEICNKNTTITYAGSPYCAGSGTATITLTGNNGGSFASTAGLVLNASTGEVDLTSSTAGSYVVTYKLDATGDCPAFITNATINITAIPGAAIVYHGSPYCVNGDNAFVTLTGTTGGTYSSAVGLSINSTTGEVNIAASTAGTYTATYTVAAAGGCAVFYATTTIAIVSPGTWTGAINNSWDNAGNWLCGAIPGPSTDVVIPAGQPAYPLITTVKAVKDITIMNGASVAIVSGTLQVSGAITNSGVLDVSGGTIELNGVSAQIIPANAFSNNTIMNLVISNNVTLAGEDTLTGTLYFGNSNKTFTTGDFLTLKSTALRTARIDDITNGGYSSGNSIAGKINIERFVPLRKAWRLLSAPVKTNLAPSIHDAWQEGVTNVAMQPDPNPHYGVHITGGTVINGFDQSTTNAASVKVFNNATNSFVPLPSMPGTNRPVTDYPGYFVYVRGDRSIDLSQGVSAAITSTTLRIKGEVKTGTHQSNVNATGYTILGNPYASAINFQTLDRTNVKNSFYRWDPMLAGSYGLGGYVAFIWNNETGTYDATASAGSLTQYIASGEAIVVQSADAVNPGQIGFKETDKSANGSGLTSNRPSGPQQQLRVNMYAINADSTASLLDGALTTYSVHNNNAVDQDDAKKMYGSNESINLKRNGTTIAIERRETITNADTSFLNIYQMKQLQYRLEINASNMNNNGLSAVLKDSYSTTNNDMPLDLNAITVVNFVVNSDPASYNVNRFSIVFKLLAPVPVTFKTIKAYKVEKNIAVEWTTETEINVQRYEVEKAADARNFSKINTTAAVAVNGGNASYHVIDTDPFDGNNYYRVRSVSNDGSDSYSNIVKVNMKENKPQPGMAVYPNPVTGNTISLDVSGVVAGTYNLQLYNKLGQLVASKKYEHMGNNASTTLDITSSFPSGRYELVLTGPGIRIVTALLKK